MAAACILILGLGGTVLAVKTSLQTICHSRHLDEASQVLQNELERLRLRSWDQLQAIQDSGDTAVAINNPAARDHLTCTRQIIDLRDGQRAPAHHAH